MMFLCDQETTDGPCWQPPTDRYTCEIKSPKKESKYHGMKSFIVYQLTPTVSHQHVNLLLCFGFMAFVESVGDSFVISVFVVLFPALFLHVESP